VTLSYKLTLIPTLGLIAGACSASPAPLILERPKYIQLYKQRVIAAALQNAGRSIGGSTHQKLVSGCSAQSIRFRRNLLATMDDPAWLLSTTEHILAWIARRHSEFFSAPENRLLMAGASPEAVACVAPIRALATQKAASGTTGEEGGEDDDGDDDFDEQGSDPTMYETIQFPVGIGEDVYP